MDQLCCKLGQSLDPPACKSIFDVDVLPLDVTKITQPLTEGVDFRRGSGRAVMQETDPRDFRWLRMRCEGPRRRAADSRDELATFHGSPSPGTGARTLPRRYPRLRFRAVRQIWSSNGRDGSFASDQSRQRLPRMSTSPPKGDKT